MSIGNEPVVTRRGSPAVRSGARRGLPSWARRRAADPQAAAAVTAVLRSLEPDGWTTLDALHGPGPAGAGHVVVGPGGVVVVGIRPWAGDEGPDGTEHAPAPTERAADAVRAAAVVTTLLAPRHRTAVRALVCLPGPTPPAADVVEGATVVGRDDLAAHLRALPERLHPADAAGLALHLRLHLGRPHRHDVLTTAALDADVRVARRRVVRPLPSGRPAGSGGLPGRGGGPLAPDGTSPAAPPPLPWPDRAAATPGHPRADLRAGHLTPAGVALRAAVVVGATWLAWAFTTAPLGLL
ncbi:hypothetical protein [Cellulomonas dongxiuzhuiae]|uniref:NERD domain-containing protein n=1 Tax=Cellulomonas dongxiuzhuiae TaxID=2819979 RepID=A0ABX8GIW5_9CELL|nr:hypothetical protein [Cellulomonas dongxiuzhuiae]MBO3094847.1 hypothetical protein [Cellulomonas dongxiuzhuiae]QWC15880.1 hypothetical protein KKR89_16745 [Cellulomonas dongxiuzhuiae]